MYSENWLMSEPQSAKASSGPTTAAELTEACKKALPGGRRVAVSERGPKEPRFCGMLAMGSSCSVKKVE